MATRTKAPEVAAPIENLPEAWDATGVVELAGFDLVDKKELLDVPFLITSVQFSTNERKIEYVYIDALRADGSAFQFNDSSSGVRAQLVRYLESVDQGAVIETGDPYDVRIACMKGLRFSEYEVKDERGRAKTARTYYLTQSGKK